MMNKRLIYFAMSIIILIMACKKEEDFAPTVIISSVSNDTIDVIPITVTFTFSIAVTEFTISDITVSNGTVNNFTAVNETVYTAEITPTAQGTVTVSIAANIAIDAASNQNRASKIFSLIYDINSPVVNYLTKLDSLVSGAGYANDVYYSLKNGVVATAPKNEWDMAFATTSQSASILINSGNKDSLFIWKGGSVADFNSASTLNISGNLATNFNDSSWYNSSAFEQTIVTSNVYDAGWGIYNSGTHDVVGDSVFILKLTDGSYKKIAILKRSGSTHEYTIRIADLAADAVAETITIPTTSYVTKNYIYYSVTNKQIVDREPDKTTWDFVFTKYDSRQAGYPLVTGILTNEDVSSAKLSEADSSINYNQVTFSKIIGNIGFDWKHFNGASYDIANPFYYVKTTDSNYYRIKLISFDFMTGTTVFEKTLLK